MSSMITISIGLDEETVKKIDAIVKLGRFKNRTALIRALILKGVENITLIEENPQLNRKLQPIIEKLLELEKPPDILKIQKPVVDLVSGERNR